VDSEGYICVPDTTMPIAIEINDIAYSMDDCPILKENGQFKILSYYFIARANLSSYSGTYRVWRAAGKKN
jgi:hypothetical protein